MSPFSAPFFWSTQKKGLLLPKRVAALWEGTQCCKGGTGKAEAAKLQDAEIRTSPYLPLSPASEAANPASWIWRPSFERQGLQPS
jgi:hypothetical protein